MKEAINTKNIKIENLFLNSSNARLVGVIMFISSNPLLKPFSPIVLIKAGLMKFQKIVDSSLCLSNNVGLKNMSEAQTNNANNRHETVCSTSTTKKPWWKWRTPCFSSLLKFHNTKKKMMSMKK